MDIIIYDIDDRSFSTYKSERGMKSAIGSGYLIGGLPGSYGAGKGTYEAGKLVDELNAKGLSKQEIVDKAATKGKQVGAKHGAITGAITSGVLGAGIGSMLGGSKAGILSGASGAVLGGLAGGLGGGLGGRIGASRRAKDKLNLR